MRLLPAAVPALLALLPAPGPAQDKPPTRSETDKLVAEYLELDGRSDDGRRREILARIELLDPLRPAEVKRWRGKLLARQRRGARLERSGANWFWEDPRARTKRGLYLVGGETGRPRGLLIGMHGGGAGSGDARSSHAAYDTAAKKLRWVSICPEVLEKTEHGWTDSGTEEFVVDLIDAALRTWKLDPNRVYLTGHSMGGYGSWTLGAHHADRVAAIAPSAGAPTPYLDAGGKVVGIVEGVIPNLRNVAAVIYQSTDDPRVPPEPNQLAVRLLEQARQMVGGYDYEYWEVSDRGHAMPEGGARALLEKVVKKVRDPVPERLTWQPVLRWKRQFYWLYWEEPALAAMVVADREENRIAIRCDKPTKGLYVLLDERVADLDEEVVVTVNEAEVWRGEPRPTLATLLLTAEHPDPELMFAARAPAFR